MKELAEVLERHKFDAMLAKSGTSKADLFAKLRLLAEVIDPPPLAQSVCRDPDDDAVLALARVSMADLIGSGDDDLLTLLTFEGIPIMTPAQAMERLQASH